MAYVAGSTSSLSVNADDSVSNNAVDVIAILVAHDRHADEVQELEKETLLIKPVKDF